LICNSKYIYNTTKDLYIEKKIYSIISIHQMVPEHQISIKE